MKTKSLFIISLIILSSILILFIILPILKMLISSNFTLLFESFKDTEIMSSVQLSIKSALISTIIALIFGIPLAYLLARANFRGKSIIEAIIDLPVMIPHTAAGIALLSVFGRRFFVGSFFDRIGLTVPGTEIGIVIGMLFVSLSYLVNHSKEGFKKINPKLENVARSLGANSFKSFFYIALPLAKRDILSGSILMWARGISEFGAVVILTYHPMTAPVLILDRFNAFGLEHARPIALLMIIISIILFSILRMINNRKD